MRCLLEQDDGISGNRIVENVNLPANDQGGQKLPDRNVKALGRRLCHNIGSGEVQLFDLGVDVVDHPLLLDHRPFGQPGRAGGVDDIGQARPRIGRPRQEG